MNLLVKQREQGEITQEEYWARSNHLRESLMNCARETVKQGFDTVYGDKL